MEGKLYTVHSISTSTTMYHVPLTLSLQLLATPTTPQNTKSTGFQEVALPYGTQDYSKYSVPGTPYRSTIVLSGEYHPTWYDKFNTTTLFHWHDGAFPKHQLRIYSILK